MRLLKPQNKNPLQLLTDAELIQNYQDTKSTEIIGEIYTRYSHILFGVALKYMKDTELAQDALLEIFNQLFDLILKYKIEDFKSWLLTVTRNHCLKELKNNQKNISFDKPHENIFYENFMENEQVIDHLLKKEQQIENLELALVQLKPEQEKCIRLFYLESKSYQEIAEETGFELKKVKSYIQNGKRNLQIILDQNNK